MKFSDMKVKFAMIIFMTGGIAGAHGDGGQLAELTSSLASTNPAGLVEHILSCFGA